ncbi:hypothetical protein K431DRAFT_65076 [Polychaeton citri CBS 116435]|uniref:Uncharacterized protein n=1 Tax=Polychaeton citri CBS 116435 TaxID=1314669 RepID=A0A9P4UQU2_9PEZI|nr:hypothetical protein K431DRAFT_65076 [Polychaeton citri CBS 116435]
MRHSLWRCKLPNADQDNINGRCSAKIACCLHVNSRTGRSFRFFSGADHPYTVWAQLLNSSIASGVWHGLLIS